LSAKRKIRVTVFRINRAAGPTRRYDTFETEVEPGTSISGLLRQLNHEQDGGLAYRVACGQGVCGTCTVKANGKPVLACCVEATDDLLLEPAFPWNPVKDLVSDSGNRPRREI
jgi:succinate dehydrogenase / fumarate reductase, iron-sulfur subunit